MTGLDDSPFHTPQARSPSTHDDDTWPWSSVTDSKLSDKSSCDATATSEPRVLPCDTPALGALFAVAREELGRGEFGVVRACMHRATGRLLACKSIDKAALLASGRMEDVAMEVLCMRGLPPHRNMVRLASVHEDARHVHLVMDLCQGGDLFDLVAKAGRLAEDFAAHIFRQAASAVAFCHAHNVLHLDVKPENLLLHTRLPPHYLAAAAPSTAPGASDAACVSRRALREAVCVKLADFGQAVRVLPGQMACGVAGSSFYMAPEVVCGRPYDAAADVWSLGVLLYVMLAGYVPFWGADLPTTFRAICCHRPDFSTHPWPSVSPLCIRLIRSMLAPNPRRRPSLQQVLAHPWLHVALGETERLHDRAPAASGADDGDDTLPSLLTSHTDDISEHTVTASHGTGADVDRRKTTAWGEMEEVDCDGSVGEGRRMRRRGEEGGGRRKRGCRERGRSREAENSASMGTTQSKHCPCHAM
ncbi:hypothetical protein CLOM_g22819 [Closterium sp. NIES-68]|nr:hypothetical protein CLOM_g22819 [Closterium sp. NIES-68]GJP72806.1 hypothetical protein CLOP_g3563 [Closterium sp. NIES-67]